MALRCSLLGHAFGDADAERTRTEQGDRVVVTVREVRTCGRCGATDVVSERTEVTAAGDAGTGEDDRRPARETAAGSAPDRSVDPETDDGVILEGGPGGEGADRADAGGRARGEWPRHERPGGDGDDGPRPWPEPPESSGETPDFERGGWPEPGGEDAGFGAEPAGSGGGDVELGDGLAPEGVGDVPDDAEIVEPAPDAGGVSAGFPGGDRGEIPPDHETEFVCPECGFAEHSAVASVRPGDVCPDCRSGYLEERPARE